MSKGSRQRPYDRDKFNKAYDRIFHKKEEKKPPKPNKPSDRSRWVIL